MHRVHKQVASVFTTNRSAVSNGSRLLEGIDGRSPAARRFRDLVQAFELASGGDATEIERGLFKQAAALTLCAEQLQADVVNGKSVNYEEIKCICAAIECVFRTIRDIASHRPASA